MDGFKHSLTGATTIQATTFLLAGWNRMHRLPTIQAIDGMPLSVKRIGADERAESCLPMGSLPSISLEHDATVLTRNHQGLNAMAPFEAGAIAIRSDARRKLPSLLATTLAGRENFGLGWWSSTHEWPFHSKGFGSLRDAMRGWLVSESSPSRVMTPTGAARNIIA